VPAAAAAVQMQIEGPGGGVLAVPAVQVTSPNGSEALTSPLYSAAPTDGFGPVRVVMVVDNGRFDNWLPAVLRN
jgi:hypothetical protein